MDCCFWEATTSEMKKVHSILYTPCDGPWCKYHWHVFMGRVSQMSQWLNLPAAFPGPSSLYSDCAYGMRPQEFIFLKRTFVSPFLKEDETKLSLRLRLFFAIKSCCSLCGNNNSPSLFLRYSSWVSYGPSFHVLLSKNIFPNHLICFRLFSLKLYFSLSLFSFPVQSWS